MAQESAYFIVDGIGGKHDIQAIKRGLDALGGVKSVSVNGNSVAVDFDNTGVERESIESKIKKLGYDVSDARFDHLM